MVDAVGGPTNLRPDDPLNPYPGLTNFSLISHGFGNPSISTALSVVQTYLQELKDVYEGKQPQPPPQCPFPLPPNNGVPPPVHMGNFPSVGGSPMYNGNRHGQLFPSSGHTHLMRPNGSIHECKSMKQEPKDL